MSDTPTESAPEEVEPVPEPAEEPAETLADDGTPGAAPPEEE